MYSLVLNGTDLKDITASDKQEFTNNFYYRYLLNNNDLSDATIKGYKVWLNQFFIWLKDNNIKQPNKDTIKAYKLYLKNANYSIGTKNQYIRAVKHLFKWLYNEGLYDNIADSIKGFRDLNKAHKKDTFTEQDIKKILNDIDTTTITGKRDKAIILLMVIGGLRVNEVINIDIQDIEQKDNVRKVFIKGKGHQDKDTYIKIIDSVYDAIKDYLATRDNINGLEPLFTGTSNRAKNKRLCKETLSQILKNRFRDSGYDSKRLTAHSLRHTTANILLKATNNDIYKVQHHLRHQDPKTTEIYLNANNKEQDTSEQDIYNQIFNADKQDVLKDVKNELNKLNTQDLSSVLEYIKSIKGGANND